MAVTLLFLAVFGLAVLLFQMRREVLDIRQRLQELESRGFGLAPAGDIPVPVAPPEPEFRVAAKSRRTAAVITTELAGAPAQAGAGESGRDADGAPAFAGAQDEPEPRPSRFADLSFESLVGGKLPIWVGGISLVFAGFFLVRYTIEAGLFGPGARSVTATIFALAMIAVSELGGRIPKIGASFTADPRVGQSLAGAGVAILYGTLYMAAEIYGLVGVPVAFFLVLATTAIAFALSLRHGPPTALMGLIGGFAAPWVAGMGASNLPSLLLYLAVFIAALFGLAVWRRWLWLLVLASGGGALWSFAMLVSAQSDLPLLGGFIALSGAGALIAAKRFAETKAGWSQAARYLPMALALLQLAVLLPKMDFSLLGWLFYFALSALSIALAWRDRALLPLVGGALLLACGPLNGAWTLNGATPLNIAMTLGIALLFGAAGHIRARSTADSVPGDGASGDATKFAWMVVALTAPVFCWFTAFVGDTGNVSDAAWGATAFVTALPAAVTAWQWHQQGRVSAVQGWATAAAALMLWMAGIVWVGGDYWASYSAGVALGVAAWANVTGGRAERRIAVLPLAAAMLAGLAASYQFLGALTESLSGERAFYASLPAIPAAARTTLLPALLILGITWQPWFATGRKTRMTAFAVGGAGVAAFLWLIAKQPASIATPGDFIRLGFAERAVLTQFLFGLGWLALSQAKQRPDWPSLRTAGWTLAAVALFRVIWFDLLLLNPVMVPQVVGPVPVANLLSGHVALTALWLWLLARDVPERFVGTARGLSLGMMIVTVLASIRQLVQGDLVSGAQIATGENYLYSAGLLALALAWLVQGIMRGAKLLRVAGLSLLTVVTLKVFLIDASALTGILRIVSFLGLGIALIGIGWAYGRVMGTAAKT